MEREGGRQQLEFNEWRWSSASRKSNYAARWWIIKRLALNLGGGRSIITGRKSARGSPFRRELWLHYIVDGARWGVALENIISTLRVSAGPLLSEISRVIFCSEKARPGTWAWRHHHVFRSVRFMNYLLEIFFGVLVRLTVWFKNSTGSWNLGISLGLVWILLFFRLSSLHVFRKKYQNVNRT